MLILRIKYKQTGRSTEKNRPVCFITLEDEFEIA